MSLNLECVSSVGTANKILEAKEKERLKDAKGKAKEEEPPRKRKRRRSVLVSAVIPRTSLTTSAVLAQHLGLIARTLVLSRIPSLALSLTRARQILLRGRIQILQILALSRRAPLGRVKEIGNDACQDVAVVQILKNRDEVGPEV